MEKVNRISIVGGSGNGKTTLANNLGKKLNIPTYHLDGFNYTNNWKKIDKQDRNKRIIEKVEEKQWIIDGTYRDTMGKRFEKSDLIIFLDYSTYTQVKGVIKRYIRLRGKERSDIPGCKERITFKFLIWVVNWRKTTRNLIIEELNKIDKNKVLIFKNRNKLNKWYKNEFNEKIII